MIIVVMGVCGSGKTTVGSLLAEKRGCDFADADQFHSDANKAKMAKGQPLSDQDRIPWLLAIHDFIKSKNKDGQSVVVTCSALKNFYREVLRLGKETLSSVRMDCTSGTSTEKISNTLPTLIKDNVGIDKEENKSTKTETRYDTENETNENLKSNSKGDHSNSNGMVPVFIHLTGSLEVLEDRLSSRKGHFMPKSLLQSQLDTLEELDEDECGFCVDIDNNVHDVINEIVTKLRSV